MALLELKKIKKDYNTKPALTGVDFVLPRGSAVTIFGSNGAGKTTLLKIMAGIMSPTEGEVCFRDKKLSLSDLRGEIYYLGHNNALYNGLTVAENLQFSARLFDIRGYGRVESILQEHDFWEQRHTLVQELSQGMKRRLAITKGFLTDPDLLILDEPFAGLDIKWRRSVLSKINDLKQQGKSLVLSTHLAEEGCDLADSIAFLHRGKIQFLKKREAMRAADIQALFNSPDHETAKWIS